MSTLAVNALQAQTGTTVSLPTGHKIVGTDAASIVAPGHIIQQVFSISVSEESTTSNTYVDTGLHLIITPKYSNSKILILGSISLYQPTNNSVAAMSVKRGSTIFGNSIWGLGYIYASAGGGIVNQVPINYLDSPSTTSATTYRVMLSRGSTGTGTAYISVNSTPSSLTALEIAQ